MSTGVTVSDGSISDFTEFKKQSNSIRYVIFKIDNGVIATEKTSESTDFSAFLAELPSNECRYAVYKMDFTTNDGRPNTKIASIAWSPDSSSVKSKMIYAGSKDALTRVLVGISVKLTATDLSELTTEIVQDACKKFA